MYSDCKNKHNLSQFSFYKHIALQGILLDAAYLREDNLEHIATLRSKNLKPDFFCLIFLKLT